MNDEAHFLRPDPRRLDTPTSPKSALKIVLVEDEPELAQLFRIYIRTIFPAAGIVTFHDGDAAWAYLNQVSPDLLISDLKHPGMDGCAMLSGLAQKGVAYPIMILSGFLPSVIRQACHCAGPQLQVHFLPKPFDLKKFVVLLQQCLNRPSPAADPLPPTGSPERPIKIVQLDDEEPLLNLVAALLKRRFTHFQLLQFQHSPSAWKILTEARPDLLITDDIMSKDREWNGEGIVHRLVAQGVNYPILLLSGWPPSWLWATRMKADYRRFTFLTNPFGPEEFYRELDRICGPAGVHS
jgi:DNA-binding NtrC family response regulator